MKKIFTLGLLTLLVSSVSYSAHACSPSQDYIPATVEGIIQGGGVVTLGKSLFNGPVVAVEKIDSSNGKYESPQHFIAEIQGHSCTTRFDEFEKGEYMVIVSPESVSAVTNTDLDDEIVFYFDSEKQALEKYAELLNIDTVVENPTDPIINPTDNKAYVPVGYTLRQGMNNVDVRALQAGLNAVLGTNLVLDGDYGRGTRAAVIQLQRQFGLFRDGVAGNQTQQILARETNGSTLLDGNPAVKAVPMPADNQILPLIDELGRKISPKCQVASFCNGPIECLNADIDVSGMAGTCEYRESYACFKNSGNICEVQESGNCGWTQTDELQMCINESAKA